MVSRRWHNKHGGRECIGFVWVNFEKSPLGSCGSRRSDSSGEVNAIVDDANTRELNMNAMIKVTTINANDINEPSCARRNETALLICGSAA